MNSKVKGILHLKDKTELSNKELQKFLEDKDVSYDDARSCPSLFRMFLMNSGNNLLAKILERGVKKGPNGKEAAFNSFSSVW